MRRRTCATSRTRGIGRLGKVGRTGQGPARSKRSVRFRGRARWRFLRKIPGKAGLSNRRRLGASDERTVNNVMRHAYRVLSDEEKAHAGHQGQGPEFHDLIEGVGKSRELSLAKTKIEEAVMWAVKHITR
jgi:hypothetical protein